MPIIFLTALAATVTFALSSRSLLRSARWPVAVGAVAFKKFLETGYPNPKHDHFADDNEANLDDGTTTTTTRIRAAVHGAASASTTANDDTPVVGIPVVGI